MRRWPGLMVGSVLFAASAQAAAEVLPLDIARASVSYVFPDTTSLDLELTPAGSEAFAAFTGKYVGRTVDLKIDGKVMMSPRLAEPINGGRISVSGKFAPGKLEGIARKISSGKSLVDVETRD